MERNIVDFRIFELGDNVKVHLIDTDKKMKMVDPIIKIKRTSISEGIFESILAEKCNSSFRNGNIYLLYSDDNKPLYIQCDGEYMSIGLSIV